MIRVTAVEAVRIRKQPHVRVTTDTGLTNDFLPDTVLGSGLHVDDEVSDARWEEICLADETLRCKHQALRWLAVRIRSREELRTKLLGKGFCERAVGRCLVEMAEQHRLDDTDFARRFAKHRLQKKPMGRRALDAELRNKGIAGAIRQVVLTELYADPPESEVALRLATRKFGHLQRGQDRERRVSAFLHQRGFGWDAIQSVLQYLSSRTKESGF